MDSAIFINTLIETRTQWDALIAQIDEQWMLEAGIEGKWSVKDIIAGCSFWHYPDHISSIEAWLVKRGAQ